MPEIKQNVYEHGGSRIWIEENGKRKLIVDSFTDSDFAKALLDFVIQYFN